MVARGASEEVFVLVQKGKRCGRVGGVVVARVGPFDQGQLRWERSGFARVPNQTQGVNGVSGKCRKG